MGQEVERVERQGVYGGNVYAAVLVLEKIHVNSGTETAQRKINSGGQHKKSYEIILDIVN